MRSLKKSAVRFLPFLIAVFTYAQPVTPTKVPPPRFSLTATLLQNVVKAPCEVLLEIAMKNISGKDIHYGADGSPGWTMFEIDVRDAAGNPVAETPAGGKLRRGFRVVSGNLSVALKPGATLKTQVMLNRVFDISRPGQYTVAIRKLDSPGGMPVKSNTVTVTVPGVAAQGGQAAPAFLIALTAPFKSIKAGWQIPIEIAVQNLSSQPLTWASWDGRNQDASVHTPDEFGSGVEVRDSRGKSVPSTEEGLDFLNRTQIPRGSFALVPIRPGEVAEQVRVIGGLLNISKPGKYTIQMALTDPGNDRLVKSNPIAVTVIDPHDRWNALPLQPPFIVTIRLDQDRASEEKFPLLVCQTNISDRALALDNGTFNDEFRILDSHGLPVSLTEEGRKNEAPWAVRGHEDRGADASHTWNIRPGQSLCGIQSLDVGWDLTKPGQYSIQIVRPDYPDKIPGQEMKDLPLVRSNTITVAVPPKTSSRMRSTDPGHGQ